MYRIARHGSLNLLRIPLELWLEIMDLACTSDDGSTAHALARTSRHLREVSKRYRYRTVKIKGTKQLDAFKEVFYRLDTDLQQMVNLYVELPSLLDETYPEWMSVPEERPEHDPDYDPILDGGGDEDTEDELSDSEYDEMREDLLPGNDDEARDVEYIDDLPEHLQEKLLPDNNLRECLDLQHLSEIKTLISSGEFVTFNDLKIILDIVAETLEVFTLRWEPHHDFRPEAMIPFLPKLRSLSIYRGGTSGYNEIGYRSCLEQSNWSFIDCPSLQRLDVNSMETKWWDAAMVSGMHRSQLLYVTLPCVFARCVHFDRCLGCY